MTLTRLQLKNFTAFAELDLELSPGINVLVGTNGTGKTHLMKVCYVACDASKIGESSIEGKFTPFIEKLVRAFLPSRRSLKRLIRGHIEGREARVQVFRQTISIELSLSDSSGSNGDAFNVGIPVIKSEMWTNSPLESTYIPVKEMLSNAPGFRSLYAQREIHFEEVYSDIIDRAHLPPLREPFNKTTNRLLLKLQRAMGGEVGIRNEEFFLKGEEGEIEFTLLAEGMRKLGLLWLLIRNGSLREGTVLFWDEPETNLNPKLYGVVMDVLLELQRDGVQIFLATHDYGILKELELRMREGDEVAFHSLYHDENTGEVACNTTRDYLGIHPNAIAEAFEDLYDREIERSLGSFGR